MKKQDAYRQALAEVRRRRQRVETQLAERRQAIFAAEPYVWQLECGVAEAGGRAVILAAQGQRGAAEEQQRQLALLAEERTRALAALGYAPTALQPQWHCPQCRDTGTANGKACQCVREEMNRLRRNEINQAGPLTLCRFERFSLESYPERMEQNGRLLYPRAHMRAVLDDCVDWAAEFGPKSQSLYLYGDAGLGKTHLALSMASVVLGKGFDVIYVSAQRAFATIAAGDDEDILFDSMLQADLLVLDDLGTELLTARVRSYIYDLVNTRMGRRPTIYTTNICNPELLERRYDEKVSSRLLGDCHPMRFLGEDIRLQKYR